MVLCGRVAGEFRELMQTVTNGFFLGEEGVLCQLVPGFASFGFG